MFLSRSLVDGKTQPLNIDITSIDSIYYPGVFDYIRKVLKRYKKRRAALVYQVYDRRPGTYQYYENNGTFTVFDDGMVESVPRMCSQAYRHKIFPGNF